MSGSCFKETECHDREDVGDRCHTACDRAAEQIGHHQHICQLVIFLKAELCTDRFVDRQIDDKQNGRGHEHSDDQYGKAVECDKPPGSFFRDRVGNEGNCALLNKRCFGNGICACEGEQQEGKGRVSE